MPVLCICLNESFSGSAQCARNARTVLLEEYPQARIYVMDSQSATVLQGLLVEEAVVLRDRGSTLEEAIDALEKIRSTGRIFFTTNDLEFRPYQIGVTIGVQTGPTPIGVGLMRRVVRP